MSDPTPTKPTDAATTPPAGDAAAPTTPPAGDEGRRDEPAERTYTAAEYRAVQNEAKNLRARLREAEQSATTAAPALEAAQRDADALRAELAGIRERLRGYELRDAIAEATRADDAADLAGLDPALAARLIEVEYGDDGRPKALSAALRKLVKQYPQLANGAPRVPAQPSAQGGGRPAPARPDDIKQAKLREGGYHPL